MRDASDQHSGVFMDLTALRAYIKSAIEALGKL